MRLAILVVVLLTAGRGDAVHGFDLKQIVASFNVSCLLVFGDSSVDPGNNNRLHTPFKANFPPYGKDFFHGHPTGRFSNGRLPTDFIAEALGIKSAIPAFLDPSLKPEQLPQGVSFASASSGYDDLTADIGKVFSLRKQIQYLLHYKIHLKRLVGEQKGDDIVKNAIFVMSAGTNDFMLNYYIESNRSREFTVQQYGDYLITCITKDIKEMHIIGARKIALVGVPPLGCLPIVRTLMGSSYCVDIYNKVAVSFNSKIRDQLNTLKTSLGMRTAFIDVYGVLLDATKNPMKYGLTETAKGCCGTGTVETGRTCMGQSTCRSPNKYMYWDAVHPSQRMYKIIADAALVTIIKELLY